jgi:hypothetical protein
MTWWDPYVEDITDTDTYLRRKFRQDVTDKTTGVGVEALKKILAEIVASGRASGESWRITKAKLFAVQMEKMSIDVSPLDWFPAIAVWDRNDRPITCMYWVHYGDSMVTRYQELRRGLRARILRNRLGGFRRDYGPHSHH